MASNNSEWLVEAVIPARVHCIVKAQSREAAERKARAGRGAAVDWWYNDDNVVAEGTVQVKTVEPFNEAAKLRVGSACKEV